MPTYKELMMSRDAFLELRNKIQRVLSANPALPQRGEILVIDIDPDTGDLMVASQFSSGQRTHRITITDETPNVSRGTSQGEG